MIPLSRHLKGNRKPVLIVGGAAAALLLAGGYAWWSVASWSDYHQSYNSWKASTKTVLSDALLLEVETPEKQAAKLEKLASVSEAIASQRSMCSPAGAVAWQKNLNSRYDQWQKECQQLLDSVETLNATLKDIVAYTRSDYRLAEILAPVLKLSDKKVSEGEFVSVQGKWKAAAADIRDMKAEDSFLPVKAKAQAAVNGVEAAWQALVTAHKVKDESKYEKAMKQLSGAYTGLESIKAQSDIQSRQLGKLLQQQYDAAF